MSKLVLSSETKVLLKSKKLSRLDASNPWIILIYTLWAIKTEINAERGNEIVGKVEKERERERDWLRVKSSIISNALLSTYPWVSRWAISNIAWVYLLHLFYIFHQNLSNIMKTESTNIWTLTSDKHRQMINLLPIYCLLLLAFVPIF